MCVKLSDFLTQPGLLFHRVETDITMNYDGKTREQLIEELAALQEEILGLTREGGLSARLLLFKNTNDIVFLHHMITDDNPGYFIEVNEAGIERLGYSLEEFKRMNPLDITSPDEWGSVPTEKETLSKQKRIISRKYLIAKNGSRIAVEINAQLFEAEGKQYVLSIARDVSDRLEYEQKLLNDQRRLERLHSLVGLGCWDWYRDENLLVWSKETFDIFGKDESSFTPTVENFEACIHPDDLPAFLAEREQALAERRKISIDHRIIRPNGAIGVVRELAEIVRDETGRAVQVSGTVQDITAFKEAQDTLSKQALRLSHGAEVAQLGHWDYEFVRQRPSWSPEMFGIFGIDPKEGEPDYEAHKKYIHPDDWATFNDAVQKTISEGVGYNLHLRLVRPDKSIRYINTVCEVHKNMAGKIDKLYGTLYDYTDLKKAEHSLAESENLLRAIIENSTDEIALFDREGRFVVVNLEKAARLGKKQDKLIGVICWENYPSELAELRKEKFNQVLTEGKPCRWQDRYAEVFYDNVFFPIIRRGGKIENIALISRNISEQKVWEKELVESEKRLKKIADNYPHSYLSIINKDMTVGFTSGQEFVRQGLDPKKYVGHSIDEIFNERAGFVKQQYLKAFTGEEVSFDLFINNQHQNYKVVPLADSEGRINQILSVVENVTDRKNAEILLEKNARRFEFESELFRNDEMTEKEIIKVVLEKAVELTDSEIGYFHFVDENEENLTLVQWSERVLQKCKGLPGSHYPIESAGIWIDSLRKRTPVVHNDYQNMPDKKGYPEGHYTIRRHLGVPIIEGEKIVALVGVGNKAIPYNQSDTKQLELFLSSIWTIIQKRRGEEERRNLEEQLRQSQKMEAIGTLAGGIAHDFNNLLTAILGYANLLKINAEPRSDTYEDAKVIEQAAERAAELTAQLLGFARKGKHQILSVNIVKMIYEVIALLGRTIDKKIVIAQDFDNDYRMVSGDPNQLQQVLMNLAINARDAMSDGGELTFRTRLAVLDEQYCYVHPGSKPGRYLLVSVSDTGHGIIEENIDRIFEPFFTTKEQGKGSGMGLAMVYGIVTNHGGFITVESVPGEGSTFDIYLPLEETNTELIDDDIEDQTLSGSGTILIVDDEEIVRNILERILNSLGYRTVTATNGVEATEYYAQHAQDVDLVILDMIMPKMGGRECYQKLKMINPRIKAILSTGYGLDGKAQALLDDGVQGFVQKPYRVDLISKAVANVLKGEK